MGFCMHDQILWTACVTPFLSDGGIDYSAIERIISEQKKCDNGIILLGSTGENLSLNIDEKKDLIDFVCDLEIEIDILVGVPNYNFDIAIDWIEYCNGKNISGYLVSTPIYTKPGILGQSKWFECILEKSNFPVMLYNIPGRAGISLHPNVIKSLHKHRNFFAIKESSGNLQSFIDYKDVDKNLKVYCGDDNIMPAAAGMGACGLISVMSNALPLQVRKYVEASLKGEEIDNVLWWKAVEKLFVTSNPIPIKCILKEKGIIKCDDVRLPLHRDDLKQDDLNKLMEYCRLIEDLV